jgi:hypothetical protein
VAESQLSVKQAAILMLGQPQPPWHLAKLLDIYGQKFVSLKETIASLSNAQAVMFVATRTGRAVAECINRASGWRTDVQDAFSYEWEILWGDDNPVLQSELETLDNILKPAGASIVYLNQEILIRLPPTVGPGIIEGVIPPWVTIGIGGSFGALANLSAQPLPFSPKSWSSEQVAWLKTLDPESVALVAPGTGFSTAAIPSLSGDYLEGPTFGNFLVNQQGPEAGTMLILSKGTGS